MSEPPRAFVPGHVTGFFSAHRHDDPRRAGSRGAGLALSDGVTVAVEPADESRVVLNGERAPVGAVEHVLDGLDRLRICTGYELDGARLDHLPTAAEMQARVRPVYEELDGWSESTAGARSWADLPGAAVKYVRRIEELLSTLRAEVARI